MATCNDCVYYPVCNYKMRCDLFKDKTNFVEVVRCKDCKWYQNLGIVGKAQTRCFNSASLFKVCNPNDFCNYGERKDEE